MTHDNREREEPSDWIVPIVIAVIVCIPVALLAFGCFK